MIKNRAVPQGSFTFSCLIDGSLIWVSRMICTLNPWGTKHGKPCMKLKRCLIRSLIALMITGTTHNLLTSLCMSPSNVSTFADFRRHFSVPFNFQPQAHVLRLFCASRNQMSYMRRSRLHLACFAVELAWSKFWDVFTTALGSTLSAYSEIEFEYLTPESVNCKTDPFMILSSNLVKNLRLAYVNL